MNDNSKNNILMSENIRQKGLTIMGYFDNNDNDENDDKSQLDNDDKYMHRNIPELLVFFV